LKDTLKQIPLKLITTSPTNPRKYFDQEKLQELADSIKSKGLLQPVVTRTIPIEDPRALDSGYEFELVAGERRFRAAQLAGLTEITAINRDLTDEEALEIQTIENLQREDLSAIEEAEGYQALIDTKLYTVQTLADKVHKSETYIRRRIQLAVLPGEAKQAVNDGVMQFGTALAIARIPDPKSRTAATKWALSDRHEVPGPAAMAMHAADNYMLDLKHAPFDTGSEKLLPACGSCKLCPKRSGNNQDLFSDVKGNYCTDSSCFQKKVDANWQMEKAGAANAGRKAIENSKQLFQSSWRNGCERQNYHGNDYLDLSESCYRAPKSETYKKLFGNLLGEHLTVYIARDHSGHIHEFVKKAEGEKALKEKYSWAKSSVASNPEMQKWQRDNKIRSAVKEQLRAIVLQADLQDEDFQLAIAACTLPRYFSPSQAKSVAGRFGWEDAKSEADVIAKIRGLKPADLDNFIFRQLIEDRDFLDYDGKLTPLGKLMAELVSFDVAALTKAVTAELFPPKSKAAAENKATKQSSKRKALATA
jgi:ParB/RepB/Spo0J family partition protein